MPGNGCKNFERVNHNHLSSAVHPYPILAARGYVCKKVDSEAKASQEASQTKQAHSRCTCTHDRVYI